MTSSTGLPGDLLHNSATLPVSEIFGPVFQGEGPSIGRRCAFLRLGGCNLACSWCDTPYTWDWTRYNPRQELRSLTYQQITDDLRARGVGMVVVTGGEPLLHRRRLPALFATFPDDWRIEIETNGTIAPSKPLEDRVAQFNVSPKLANSHNPEAKRLNWDTLIAFRDTGKAAFKFVALGPEDLTELDAIVARAGLDPATVYVMPEGKEAGAVTTHAQALAQATLDRGYNLTTRLHVQLYGSRRGV